MKLIDEGQRREDAAELFKVGRVTLHRALAGLTTKVPLLPPLS
jgi:hypothetical protein